LSGDVDFNATGAFDNDGDYFSNGAISFTPVDCTLVPVP
jgi:hypothetical protein